MCGSWIIFRTLAGFAIYIADLATDVILAKDYYKNGDFYWFGLTLGFALGPQLIANIVLAYLDDASECCPDGCKWSRWVYMLLLGVPIKYLEVLLSFVRGQHGPEDIWRARKTERQATREPPARAVNHLLPLARLVGTLLESLPELCLQIYILQDSSLEIQPLKVVTMVMSFIASLYSIIEWEAHFPKVVAWFWGIIILFLWKIIDLSARIFAVCLFASASRYWVFVALGIHWFVMVVVENVFYHLRESNAWVESEANVISNSNPFVKFLFNTFMVAPADVLTWVTFGSRLRCKVQPIVNNVLMLVANVVMILLWSCAKENEYWYVAALVIGGSAVSVLLQLFYWVCYESCCPCSPIDVPIEYKRVNSIEMT